MSSSISPTVAFLFLNFVTVLWGSQHAVIKLAIQADSGMSPAELNLDRFLISALIFLPFAPKLDLASLLKNPTNTPVDNDCSSTREGASTVAEPRETDAAEQNATWLAGLELGFWMFAGYAMQSVHYRQPICFPPLPQCQACSDIRQRQANQPGHVGLRRGLRDLVPETPAQAAAAVYLGVVTTAVTNFLQTLGQRTVAAERAALIYALDPVYAAAFAYALFGERLGPQGFAGAALLLLAAVAGQRQAAGAAAVDPAAAGGGGGVGGEGSGGGGGGGGGGGDSDWVSDREGADRPELRESSPPPAAKGYGAADSDA